MKVPYPPLSLNASEVVKCLCILWTAPVEWCKRKLNWAATTHHRDILPPERAMSGNFKAQFPHADLVHARNLDAYNGNALINSGSPHGRGPGPQVADPLVRQLVMAGRQNMRHPMMGVPVMTVQVRGGVRGVMCSPPVGPMVGSPPLSQHGPPFVHNMHHMPPHPGSGGNSQGRKRRHNQQSPAGGAKHSRLDSPVPRGQPGPDMPQQGRNLQPPRPLGGDRVSDAIMHYFVSHVQSSEDYERKKQLRNSLYQVLQGVFPYCGLYIVGSSLSGFATKRSDVDMCLMLSEDYIDQKKEATEILFAIHRSIRKCSFVRESEVIRAKVPILKFKDSISLVECDLNINNSVGIRNTHLLRYYANADPRVRPLMLFIKNWARFHDINDARKMTISSYSLALMLVHYLQVGCKPPVLPSLQQLFPAKFHPDSNVQDLRLDERLPLPIQHNQMSLGDLFLGFLHYFSYVIDYNRHVISVREGKLLSRSEVEGRSSTPNQWKYLCVEEPFDRSNTARAVFDPYTFQRITRIFRTSHETLEKTREVLNLFRDPF